MRKHRPLALLSALAMAASAAAASPESPAAAPLPLVLLDAPEVVVLPQHAPSWEQALNLHTGLVEAAHVGLHLAFDERPRRWWTRPLEMLLTFAFDLGQRLWPLPLGEGWLHEEGHRSALGVAGIPSQQVFNNVFYAPSERCDDEAVCGMTDAQIEAAKAASPAAWVRAQAAGLESELEAQRRLARNAFFYDLSPLSHLAYSWISFASVQWYLSACTDSSSFGPETVSAESAHMLQRDFTGPDCRGWAYDLHRPLEAFSARGEHPNGNGVRRARLLNDLSPAEQRTMIEMRNLNWLNLIDPQFFGLTRFTWRTSAGRRLAFNASVQHDLTAFGDAIALQILYQADDTRLFATARAYRSSTLVLPGATFGVIRQPLQWGRTRLYGSLTAELWLQPTALAFFSTAAALGGAVEVSAAMPFLGPLELFASMRAKTAGWRPVDPLLEAAVSARVGVSVLLPAHGRQIQHRRTRWPTVF